MKQIFPVVLFLYAVVLAATTQVGLVMDSGESAMVHVMSGLVTAIFTLGIHCLVLFYLIGCAKDIKKALEEHRDLWERYVPRTLALKRRSIPLATTSIAAILIASFAGAYVHSELLAAYADAARRTVAAEDIVLPVRQVPFWWIHLALLIPALLLNFYTFFIEFQVVRDNVDMIHEVNAELVKRASGKSRTGRRSPDEPTAGEPENSGVAATASSDVGTARTGSDAS